MNTSYFIAKKLIRGSQDSRKASRPIVRISILSISLGIFVMILTLSIVTGFKNQVRNKVIGFGSHIQVMQAGGGRIFESLPMVNDRAMIDMVEQIPGVDIMAPVAYFPGIFQSSGDSVEFTSPKGDKYYRSQKEISGVILKGIDSTYDQHFFEEHLKEGRMLEFSDTSSAYELLVSNKTAEKLQFKIGDKIPVYFVHDQPFRRNFEIVGIFETGLDDFDSELAITKLETVQKVSGWGLETSISLADTLHQNRLLIHAQAKGGQGFVRYDWGSGFGTVNKQAFVPQKDTLIRVVSGTYKFSPYEEPDPNGIYDTAYFRIQVKGDIYSGPPELKDDKLVKNYLDDAGFRYSIKVGTATLVFEEIHSRGTATKYLSGYEITVDDWEKLGVIEGKIRKELRFFSMENDNPIDVLSIQNVYPDIFVWLDFLDINFSIIVILMIAISIITMGASLLVLILEKTSTIGLLKALGASDWTVRKVFLYQSAYLILRGMIWGNLAGILISLLQMQFNIFPLDPEVYYLNAVPIELNWFYLLLLNVFTVLVCLLALILPSYFVTRVRPTEAIKFS